MGQFTPRFLTSAVSDASATLDFEALMGSLYVKNSGLFRIYCILDNPVAVAGFTDGQFDLGEGEALNLDNIQFSTISFICDTGESSQILVGAVQRPGENGTGV